LPAHHLPVACSIWPGLRHTCDDFWGTALDVWRNGN
jgi:hypothetical protein